MFGSPFFIQGSVPAASGITIDFSTSYYYLATDNGLVLFSTDYYYNPNI